MKTIITEKAENGTIAAQSEYPYAMTAKQVAREMRAMRMRKERTTVEYE